MGHSRLGRGADRRRRTSPNPAIRLLTHDIGDPRPYRVQAAIDLGLVGISILYTWSGRSH